MHEEGFLPEHVDHFGVSMDEDYEKSVFGCSGHMR
jgi:hypothetical protein